MACVKKIQLFLNWLVYSFSYWQNSYEVQFYPEEIREVLLSCSWCSNEDVFLSPKKEEGKLGGISYNYKFFLCFSL